MLRSLALRIPRLKALVSQRDALLLERDALLSERDRLLVSERCRHHPFTTTDSSDSTSSWIGSKRDLIYDIGLHIGDDTDFYLAKGFRVVAVEANPRLVQRCKERFSDAISAGSLIIEEGAVADSREPLTFYINKERDEWSSIYPGIGGRDNIPVEKIRVEPLSLADLFAKHGCPHYLKIDIEGADELALAQLARTNYRPKYVSAEANDIGYLVRLRDMGYSRFKLVNQGNYFSFRCPNPPLEGIHTEWHFSIYSSGPFGEESPGRWMDFQETAAFFFQVLDILHKNPEFMSCWMDFHATR
jgi:FkbM family methyltransferase